MLVNNIKGNLVQLIVWRENGKIVGHAVWHESSTEEHRKGGPRDKEDKEALEKLLGGKKDLVELHEWWLIETYRGKEEWTMKTPLLNQNLLVASLQA